MKDENLDSLLERFHKIAEREISSHLRRGPTDLETICQSIEESSTVLLGKLEPLLGKQQWRIIVRRKLKRTRIELPEALKQAAQEAAQPEFDFHDIEQFRGIPDAITYEDQPGHVTYIHYLDTSKRIRKMARNYLAASIESDQKQLNALDAGNDHADALTEELGGDEDAILRDILEQWFRRNHGNGDFGVGA